MDGEYLSKYLKYLNTALTLLPRKNYICVEPGYVRGFVKLEPQKQWLGQQVLTVVQ